MDSTYLRVVAAFALFLLAPALVPGGAVRSGLFADRMAIPPLRETFLSPDRRFQFVVAAVNGNWYSLRCFGTLVGPTENGRREYWNKVLPNRVRPRFVRVANTGFTVTFDDWELLKSAHSIVVYNATGDMVRQYGFDEVLASVRLDEATVVERSKEGLWMTGRPKFDSSGTNLLIPVAGRTLVLQMPDGPLKLK